MYRHLREGPVAVQRDCGRLRAGLQGLPGRRCERRRLRLHAAQRSRRLRALGRGRRVRRLRGRAVPGFRRVCEHLRVRQVALRGHEGGPQHSGVSERR